MVLLPGEYETRYEAEYMPSRIDADVEMRARLREVVFEILTYRDDAVQRKYRKVFPGIEGKLYGSSNAELDEIIVALLNMKEDFLAGAEPELHQMFNEMETLALHESSAIR
jgi:hypothetical protein